MPVARDGAHSLSFDLIRAELEYAMQCQDWGMFPELQCLLRALDQAPTQAVDSSHRGSSMLST